MTKKEFEEKVSTTPTEDGFSMVEKGLSVFKGDEVWTETSSFEPGVRHNDLVGWIPYEGDMVQVCGSSNFRMVRRKIR